MRDGRRWLQPYPDARRLIRRVFVAFLLTFIAARLLVIGIMAWLYGVGLALTFDEFGMWLHLRGGYWQRASFDAMTALVGLLGIAAFAPPIARWRPKHWGQAVVLVVVAGFYSALALSFRWAAREEPRLEHLEQTGPG